MNPISDSTTGHGFATVGRRACVLALCLAAVLAGCEFNSKINVNPQAAAEALALSACPADHASHRALDLLLVSDRDQLIEAGSRLRRGARDHCTISMDGGEPDACGVDLAFADGTLRDGFDASAEATPASLSAEAPTYCDAAARCGADAAATGPLHLAIVVDNGAEDANPALDERGARIAAAQKLAYQVLCAEDDVAVACPFAGAEARVWWLGGDDPGYRTEGNWSSDPGALAAKLDDLAGRASGDGNIWGAVTAIAEAVAARAGAGDARAIVLVTTNGRTTFAVEEPPAGVPVHVVSLATTEAIEEQLSALACATGGSYQVIAGPSGYTEALRRARMALRGRWRAAVDLGATPPPGTWDVTVAATVGIGEPPVEVRNDELTFRVRAADAPVEDE